MYQLRRALVHVAKVFCRMPWMHLASASSERLQRLLHPLRYLRQPGETGFEGTCKFYRCGVHKDCFPSMLETYRVGCIG